MRERQREDEREELSGDVSISDTEVSNSQLCPVLGICCKFIF
jgi:hypothetical protein